MSLMKHKTNFAPSVASRRGFLQSSLIGGVAAAVYPALGAARAVGTASPAPETKPFELDEITIDQLQEGMKSGKYTARSITEKYLGRIHELDKEGLRVNSVIEVNPDALEISENLDREQAEKRARAAARNPSPHQGQHRYGRQDDDDSRIAGARRWAQAAQGFIRRPTVAQSWSRYFGQNKLERVGEHSLEPLEQRVERAWRADEESIRP